MKATYESTEKSNRQQGKEVYGVVPKAFRKLLIARSSAFQLVFARSPEGDVANSSRLRKIASSAARNHEDRIVGY